MGESIKNEIRLGFAERLMEAFGLPGVPLSIEAFGNGHINGTFRLTAESEGQLRFYAVQEINSYVFRRPYEVMENIVRVTGHLKRKGIRTLKFYTNRADGSPVFFTEGTYWRVSDLLPGTSFDETDDLEILKAAGQAFGSFVNALSDLDSTLLHETIPAFHDTTKRFNALKNAEKADLAGRKDLVREELRLSFERAKKACLAAEALSQGRIPSRITHNDMKFNNVIIDPETKRAVAVIDLDTVMPGTLLFDYGDAIRYLANTAAEDESDLSKVRFDLKRFRAFSEGFLGEVRETLTGGERELLAVAPFSATVECGIRFLTDYLDGDCYFKIAYPEHNLVRARNQLALAADMERQEEAMRQCIEEILK
ncbi:MAG: aminoglycoside phosphotransferase family protein [Lachnospiraceae bacterium]|nr:aminoglycoside phosphotransferase family protein [Lachnospiraceae bacterium]